MVQQGNTIIRPAGAAENAFEAYAGVLAGTFPKGVREIKSWIDEMRREEPEDKGRRGQRSPQ